MSNHDLATKDVQIEMSGHNKHGKHSSEDIARMVELLSELLSEIGCSGTFKVRALSVGIKGSPSLQGLSVVGFNVPHTIGLGYQLRNNDSRCKYHLFVPTEQATAIWERLKKASGTAYLGKPEARSEPVVKPKLSAPPARLHHAAPMQPKPVEQAAPVADAITTTAIATPTVFPSSDSVWIADYVKRATILAEAHEHKWLTKSQVITLIAEMANLPSTWRAGPIFRQLRLKGWLAEMPGEMFKPITENPVPTRPNQKKRVPAVTVVIDEKVTIVRSENRFATAFFSNIKLQREFFCQIGSNAVARTELTKLILETFPHWKPQAAGHLFGYLTQKGYLVHVGKKKYACGPKGLPYVTTPVIEEEKPATVKVTVTDITPKSEITPPAQHDVTRTGQMVSEPTPVSTPAPSTDLQARVELFAKTKRYKESAESETIRADTAEASLAVALQENSSLQAQIQDFDRQVEIQARALLDQMIKDL